MTEKKIVTPKKGGKACLKKHGKEYYSKISTNFWNSPEGKRRKTLMKKMAKEERERTK